LKAQFLEYIYSSLAPLSYSYYNLIVAETLAYLPNLSTNLSKSSIT